MRTEPQRAISGTPKWSETLSSSDLDAGFKGWYRPRGLPHFDSPGTQQFITYRLADSMPSSLRNEWEALVELEDDQEKQRKIEAYLDRGLGACHLRNPRIAEMVQNNLWYFDGVHYGLLAWVIMPNHLHVAVEFWRVPMGKVVKAWKGYTGKEANKRLGVVGIFWAKDYFDRYIRDGDHLRRVKHYIEANPVKAGLVRRAEDWPWSSARYRSKLDITGRTLTHPTAGRVPPVPVG
jgi:REP element-mobilizing transposase RayT